MNLSNYTEEKPHYKRRIIWFFVNHTIFRILYYGRLCCKCRNLLLRIFGATIDKDAYVYPTCEIFAPWNLIVGRACIGPKTRLYCKGKIVIGNDCVISQGSYLCTASHNISCLMLPLKIADIIVKDYAWVAADAFIGPGVTIEEGAVVGARAAVFKDVGPWTVVGGNPAQYLKDRIIKDK